MLKFGMAAIAGSLTLIAGIQSALATPPASEFKTFADWCLNQEKLSPAAKHTVEVLLKRVRETDCQQANDQLYKQGGLNLSDRKISDLRPLRSLINLETLSLGGNEINDLEPLRSLKKLIILDLEDNRISDISPLKVLTSLDILTLGNNQISDISPLSPLIHL